MPRIRSQDDDCQAQELDVWDRRIAECREGCQHFECLYSDLERVDDWTRSGWMIGIWAKGGSWTVHEAMRAGWREDRPAGQRQHALTRGANACERRALGHDIARASVACADGKPEESASDQR